MAAWLAPALGAAAGLAGSLFSGNQGEEVNVPQWMDQSQTAMFQGAFGQPLSERSYWATPSSAFRYGPDDLRIHQGASPETAGILNSMIARGTGGGAPYERMAQNYGTGVMSGQYLGSSPAMGFLAPYAGGRVPGLGRYASSGMVGAGPGRNLMLSTAAGGGYNNPHLKSMVGRAMDQAAGRVGSMFGRSGMGGSSMESQIMARELGGVASDMYGRAYEGERARQAGMQSALGSLETSRMGQAINAATGQGQLGVSAAGRIGDIYGQERGLQQEAALNAGQLSGLDWNNLQRALAASQGLEGYGQAQRGEELEAWRQNQLAPITRLGVINAGLRGMPTSRETQTERYVNPLTAAMGGAMTGYGLYRGGMFGGPSPGGSTYQTGAGTPTPMGDRMWNPGAYA